VMISQTQSWDL